MFVATVTDPKGVACFVVLFELDTGPTFGAVVELLTEV